MASREQKFFDGFMLLVGVWVGAIAGIILFGNFAVGGDGHEEESSDISAIDLVGDRIRPIGQVALVGDPDVGVTPVASSVVTNTVHAPLSGPQVYNDICYLCHTAPGVGGAPVLGDAAAWAPRLSQPAELIQDHVINGYQGEAGYMPPKGGRLDLTDEEILEAIAFMLEAVE